MLLFYIPADPGVPDVETTKYTMGSCALNISWTAPNNIAMGDITHFMIYINEKNICNKSIGNNDTFLFLSCPVKSCDSHNVSVNAVNRCGREGPLSSPRTVRESFCDNVACMGANPITNNGKYNNYII